MSHIILLGDSIFDNGVYVPGHPDVVRQDEVAYLVGRADAEFQAAQRAKSLTASRPHYTMAVQYLERAEALERRRRG